MSRNRTLALVVAAVGAIAGSGVARAQGTVVSGRVLEDPSQRPIAAAEVVLDDSVFATQTDSAGRFRLERVARGAHNLMVRAPGHSAVRVILRADGPETVVHDIALVASVGTLAPVAVIAQSGERVPAKLAGFEFRRAGGIGRFLTSADLAKVENDATGNALVRRMAGLKLERHGSVAYAITSRAQSRLAFSPTTTCYSDVYLDGIQVFSASSREPPFDVNSVPVRQLSAIEYYSGPSEVPVQYNKTGAMCGVLLLWTK